VHLVDDELLRRDRRRLGTPLEARRVNDPRVAAQAVRLVARAGVGTTAAVEEDVVVVAGGGIERPRPEAIALLLEGMLATPPEQPDRDRLIRVRCPDAELDSTIGNRDSAERALPWIFRRRSQGSSGRR
jgi:hypothetical protein